MKTSNAVTALAALAQPTRLQAFRLLVQVGSDGLAAGAIAARLEVPPATLSFHLKELVHAGLIVAQRQSRSIFYRVQIEGMRDLLEFLTADCCQGRPELCGLATTSPEFLTLGRGNRPGGVSATTVRCDSLQLPNRSHLL